nr:MAG TPA: hypothetical protein [Caudoviricetes sp.]
MNKKLHILFALRPDYKENPGGDTIQMETWCSCLCNEFSVKSQRVPERGGS